MRSVGLLQHVLVQVGAAHPHVDDLDAQMSGFGAQLVADFAHHHGPVGRQRGIEGAAAIGLAQGRVETRRNAGFGLHQVGAQRFAEQPGIR